MMPIGPLMKEHRLIERMLRIVDKKLNIMEQQNEADLNFIDIAVDFIKNYADKRHHGKEENIIFRDLSKKQLSAEHKRTMEELIREHVMGRSNVKKVIDAKESYFQGNKDSLKDIIYNIGILIRFYPKHIEKEDKHFFISCMDYFSEQERDSMLKEGEEFDKRLGQTDYEEIVKQLEERK
jgi:hemerythrin-like domain-containing protein